MMNLPRAIRSIASRMPQDLRLLRAKAMLEPVCETLGVEDVRCPACNGAGWLDADRLEDCPVCGGFCEVPDRLADWFKSQRNCLGDDERSGALRRHMRRLRPWAAGFPRIGLRRTAIHAD